LIYQNTIHVPLIVRAPGGPRDSRVDDNASLVDIVPTVLGLTGLAAPPQVEGADLSGYLTGAPPKRPRLLYTESLWPELYGCCGLFGVIDGSWKYIRAPKPELYDLSRDGEEKNNLVERQPQIARRLRDRLEQWEKAIVAAAKPQGNSGASLPKGTLQQLESFGYVGGGTGAADFGADLKLEDAKDFVVNFERCKTATELMAKRRYDEAGKLLLEVVAERPKVVLVHYWLGQIAVFQSRPADAVRELSTAVSLLGEAKVAPTSSAAEARRTQAMHCHMELGRALILGGKQDPAIVEFQTAFGMEPNAFEDNTNLVNLLAVRGRFVEAIAHCRKVLETAPGNMPMRNKLAWMLATCPDASVRNGAEAVAIARRLTQGAGGNEPNCMATLAAAYAEAGQFPPAVAAAERAVALARSAGQAILALKCQSQLALYRAGRPCREAPTGGVTNGPQAAGGGE
jgi:tetratricopeptide (TPR) repeat protein